MRFARSTHLLMCLSLGTFNIHHKDWLTYSGGTDRPGELCYNFSISNDLTQIVNFPTRIPGCDSHSPALLDLFISLNLVLLLLLVKFVSGFRLEMMYISLIISIRLNLAHLQGFQLLVLLP